jgi:PAS domain S-box-containing protein
MHRRFTWSTGLLAAAGFALAYVVLAQVGLTLRATYNGDAIFWGCSGLSAAVFAYTSPKLRWHLLGGIFIAAAATNVYHGLTIPMAAGSALANTVEGVIAGTFLGQRIPERRRLVRLADVRTLLLAAILGSGAGSLIGGATMLLSGFGTVGDTATWFAVNAVGIFTISPAVLAVASLKREPVLGGWQLWTALMILATAAVLLVADWLGELTGRNLTYLVLVPLLLSALWIGQRGTSLLVAAVSIFLIGMASHGLGAFARTESSLDPVMASLFFMTVVQTTVLTMAIEAGRRRDALAEMRGILNAAVEAVLVVDETGIIRGANPGAAAMFITTEEKLVGSSLSTHIPDVDSLPDHPTDQVGLIRGQKTNGTEFWAEISEGEIAEPSGRRRRAVIVRDVTDRIETENKVRRIQDEFVSNMTHELKTPLTAIIGFSDWLMSNPDSPDAAEDLQIIHNSAISLQELIDNILEFKRLSSIEGETLNVDLGALLLDIIAMNRPAAAERRITISSSSQSTSAIVGDRRQMEQAIRNLVSNAVKYSKVGGKIAISLQDIGTSVVLTVHDDGIGISDEDQKRLFERFFRASNAGDIPGTGLGLVMVRQIAEGHGGELTLVSELGEGTTVEMRLPAVPRRLSPGAQTKDINVGRFHPRDPHHELVGLGQARQNVKPPQL